MEGGQSTIVPRQVPLSAEEVAAVLPDGRDCHSGAIRGNLIEWAS